LFDLTGEDKFSIPGKNPGGGIREYGNIVDMFKRYADDYDTVITTDENGNEKKTPVYHGKYFEISLNNEELRKFKRVCIELLGLIAVFHITGGFVANVGMYMFFIALPYVFIFLPLMYLAIAIFRIPDEKRSYRRDEVGLSFERVNTTSWIILVFLGIAILGEIAFMVFFAQQDFLLRELLFLAVEIIAAVFTYILVKFQKRNQISPAKNSTN
jgi:hypothetical protein